MRHASLIAFFSLIAAACAGSPTPEPRPVPYVDAPGTIYAPLRSPWPSPRGVAPTVLNVPGLRKPEDVAEGAVCGDPRIIGKRIGAIDGAGACGIAEPVRVTSVAGVRLKNPIRVNCGAAKALADWTEKSAKPAADLVGARLIRMRPIASYACRTRNNKKGARLSEHAKGNAVDIAAFTFSNARTISVSDGWRSDGSEYLRRVWKGACGPFGTVLGPDADRYHQNHFHLDIARHRGGPYCR